MALNYFKYSIKMQFEKILNLLDIFSDDKILPKLVTKKRIEVYDQLGENYSVNKEIRIKSRFIWF